MTRQANCFLFPAFVLKYKGNEPDIVNSYGIQLYDKLKLISEICNTDLTDFHIEHNNYLDNELNNQLITYTFSCIYSDILKRQNIFPDAVAGLSMGIYAALFSCNSISFEDGAILIKRIFEHLKQLTGRNAFSMMNVVGLSASDLSTLTTTHCLQAEIVIKNGDFSFILSGKNSDIQKLNELVRIEGALYSNIFPVSIPYHSSFLNEFEYSSESCFSNIKLTEPGSRIYSSVSQNFIHTAGEIRSEIIKNLILPVSWKNTMQNLNSEGGITFYECGPGNSLTKIAGFLDGEFRIKKISRQCENSHKQK